MAKRTLAEFIAEYGSLLVSSSGTEQNVPYWLHGSKGTARGSVNPLEQILFMANNRARAELGIPGMFGISKEGKLYLTPAYSASIGYRTQMNLSKMAASTVFRGSENTFDVLRLFGEALLVQAGDTKYTLNANKELAARMHDALKNSYGQRVERRRQVPSYKRANRLAGRLRTAINAPDMVVGTATGINYINQDRLNVEARHWQRINFGVRAAPGAKRGQAQSKAPERFKLSVGGRSIGTVGLTAKPRPPMYLPPGFWLFIGSSRSRSTPKTDIGLDDEPKTRRATGSGAAARRAERNRRLGLEGSSSAARDQNDDALAGSGLGALRRALSKNYRRPLLPGSLSNPRRGSGYGPVSNPISYRATRRFGSFYYNPDINPDAPVFGRQKRKKDITNPNRGVRKSQQMFAPTGRHARYPTAGVVASNFIDGGFKALQTHINDVYTRMVADMQDEAEDTAQKRAVNRTVEKFKPGFLVRDLVQVGDKQLPRRRR